MMKEEYLGDGLYVRFDGYQFVLMSNSPVHPSDTVYLDPHVTNEFLKFVKRCTETQEEE